MYKILNQKKRGRKAKKIDLNRLDKLKIPFSVFRNTDLTVYESLVFYLKEKHEITFREISFLLDKNERNIWTIYHRAKKKHEEK